MLCGSPLGAHNIDRKSIRLNSSHMSISYAVFCLKKKNMHCDCLIPQRLRNANTMYLPLTHGMSSPLNATRRCLGTVKYTWPVDQPKPSVVDPTPIPTAPYAQYARLCES